MHFRSMMLAIVWLSATMLAGPAHADRKACSITNLDACDTTNELVWDKGFDRAVAKFLGNRRTEYLYSRGMLLDEITEVLGGPPDDRVEFDGRYLFTACRAHSCDEKGAAVLRKDGQIDALAIVWYPCSGSHDVGDDCARTAQMTVFMRDPSDAKLVERLRTWITNQLANSGSASLPPAKLGKVHVHRRPIKPVAGTNPKG